MNNQESMFSPQENRPREQRNTDPREQPYKQQSWQEEAPDRSQDSYEEGYRGAIPETDWISTKGEKLRPPPPRAGAAWQWIIGAIIVLALAAVLWALISFILGFILLLLGVALVALAVNQLIVRKVVMPPRIFQLDGQPALVIRNPAGSLRVHSGTTNTVEVVATKYISGWFGNLVAESIGYVQDGNTIRVATDGSYYRWLPLGGLRGVTFDITVPPHCDIQVQGSAGTIQIEGVNGQIKAETSAGTINVEQATLEGQSFLTTRAGTIHVEETMLKGQVNFSTNAGTIYFEGALDPQGAYCLETSMGTVDVIIPPDSSFALTATTALGTLTNEFGSTLVGPAPNARLELRSSLGTVTVRKG